MKKKELNCGVKQNLSIWYCEICKSVHLCLGENSLTFSPQEFMDFASVIGELYGRASLEALKQETSRGFSDFAGEFTKRVSLTLNYQ